MKITMAVIALMMTLSSVSQASKDDYAAAYEAIFTTGAITCFPLIPLTIVTNISQGRGPFELKMVLEAQEDLAYFIASEGQERPARLGRALEYVRQTVDVGAASDIEIATRILGSISQ
ncbi:hypothetical protein D3C72_1136240 [compost metagenome]